MILTISFAFSQMDTNVVSVHREWYIHAHIGQTWSPSQQEYQAAAGVIQRDM